MFGYFHCFDGSVIDRDSRGDDVSNYWLSLRLLLLQKLLLSI
jgi:hypothetical protein